MDEDQGMDDEEYMSSDDIVEENNVLLNALIDLLIKKNVISEDELKSHIEEMEKEIYDDEQEGEEP